VQRQRGWRRALYPKRSHARGRKGWRRRGARWWGGER
jgi:hypothetical protein